MQTVTLGRTGITVNKNGFGALPIQRVSAEYAGKLLRKAFDAGITYFDTARSYTDSEEKMGLALSDVRDKLFIATKTPSTTVEGFWQDLETSLRLLKTDYIDVYQFHNPDFCPKPGDGTGLYEAMLEAKAQGKIRFIGITNHRPWVAEEAAASDLYDTLPAMEQRRVPPPIVRTGIVPPLGTGGFPFHTRRERAVGRYSPQSRILSPCERYSPTVHRMGQT